MSVVTGIIICFSFAENHYEAPDLTDKYPIIDEINEWLEEYGKSALHALDDKMCNGKHPQMAVFGGGYNYFPDEEFIEFFKNRKWVEKEQVFMIINPENTPMRIVTP